MINGHKFVDLGLPSGLLWAECNIGASEPEEAGYSYRWGEVEADIVNEGYKFKDGNTYTKYTKKDAKTTLEPEDDAATVLWGKNCHIPTKKEFEELVKYCKWKFADEMGDATVLLLWQVQVEQCLCLCALLQKDNVAINYYKCYFC